MGTKIEYETFIKSLFFNKYITYDELIAIKNGLLCMGRLKHIIPNDIPINYAFLKMFFFDRTEEKLHLKIGYFLAIYDKLPMLRIKDMPKEAKEIKYIKLFNLDY